MAKLMTMLKPKAKKSAKSVKTKNLFSKKKSASSGMTSLAKKTFGI